MKRLLVIGPLPEQLQTPLASAYALTPLWTSDDAQRLLREETFDAGVTMAKYPVPEGVLESLRGKALVSYGVGTENLPTQAAQTLGVQLSNTPDTATTGVAEMALGLMLAASRRIVESDRYVRAGRWEASPFGLSRQVTGKRLGIVGLGRIGRAVARMASGFDMQVAYTGNRPQADVPYAFVPQLEALARMSDYLVLCVPGGDQTRHLVSHAVLDALGPEGYLINVARGSVVDEAALLDALREGRIAGAGIDVCDNEPAASAALRAEERLVITPHIAAVTQEGRQAMTDLVLRNLDAYFTAGTVLTPVRA